MGNEVVGIPYEVYAMKHTERDNWFLKRIVELERALKEARKDGK